MNSLVGEGIAKLGDVGPDVRFHPINERRQLGRGALGSDQLCFEVVAPPDALLQLHDQLGDVV